MSSTTQPDCMNPLQGGIKFLHSSINITMRVYILIEARVFVLIALQSPSHHSRPRKRECYFTKKNLCRNRTKQRQRKYSLLANRQGSLHTLITAGMGCRLTASRCTFSLLRSHRTLGSILLLRKCQSQTTRTVTQKSCLYEGLSLVVHHLILHPLCAPVRHSSRHLH
jgi:hypothetical protein